MIVHCTRKLAAKLPDVSKTASDGSDSLGSWHAGLFMIDRRQCVLFCHDASRYCLARARDAATDQGERS